MLPILIEMRLHFWNPNTGILITLGILLFSIIPMFAWQRLLFLTSHSCIATCCITSGHCNFKHRGPWQIHAWKVCVLFFFFFLISCSSPLDTCYPLWTWKYQDILLHTPPPNHHHPNLTGFRDCGIIRR